MAVENLRLFKMSGIRPLFYTQVLFRLIERKAKGRKHFDIVLVSDRRLYKALSSFKRFFSVPVVYIERPAGTGKADDQQWRAMAREIAAGFKKEKVSNEL